MTDLPEAHTIHQHPLTYLLGFEGVALMRASTGEYDRAFTEARFAEVRELLDNPDAFGPGVDVPRRSRAGHTARRAPAGPRHSRPLHRFDPVPAVQESPDGSPRAHRRHSHGLGDYLRAALSHGYVLRACE
ncbi:MAG TPA: hypothetical protein VFZ21_11220 [Gemmatimonadaceae bacterium]|nr:hypothetical protein [Gemmatimonadaceae bacterium]